ncbi:MAG: hypothetical protein IPL91_15070 [Hyphomicrobium sp.]|nr:hypothetical protein [Hyphomicrobium sp.]
MPNKIDDTPDRNMADDALALWMLGQMRNSEDCIAVIQAARRTGKRDVLDEPDYVSFHNNRRKKLYLGDDDDIAELPTSVVAKIEAIMDRDAISSVEEFIEKVIGAYLAQHPLKSAGLPMDWQTTFAQAEAEIDGHSSGAFGPGFVAGLAASAREAIDHMAAQEQELSAGHDGRE